MIRENSASIWYGTFIAIIFFAMRFLFEAWNYPIGDEIWRNAYAGGIGIVGGLSIGYILRNQLEIHRFYLAIVLVCAGVAAYLYLT